MTAKWADLIGKMELTSNPFNPDVLACMPGQKWRSFWTYFLDGFAGFLTICESWRDQVLMEIESIHNFGVSQTLLHAILSLPFSAVKNKNIGCFDLLLLLCRTIQFGMGIEVVGAGFYLIYYMQNSGHWAWVAWMVEDKCEGDEESGRLILK